MEEVVRRKNLQFCDSFSLALLARIWQTEVERRDKKGWAKVAGGGWMSLGHW